MSVDFAFKIVVLATGAELAFVEPYTIAEFEGDSLDFDIPSAEAPRGDGGDFMADSTAGMRIVSYGGTLLADDHDQLRGYLDALSAAHPEGGMVKFYRHSDRYLLGRVSRPPQGQPEEVPALDWRASLRCFPWYYSEAASTQALPQAGGTVAVAVGGNLPALPTLTVVVSSPGTVTLTVAGMDLPLTLAADVVGTYVLDADAGTAVRTGFGDVLDKVGGEFPRLFSNGSGATLGVTLSFGDGAALSADATLSWRPRWRSNV